MMNVWRFLALWLCVAYQRLVAEAECNYQCTSAGRPSNVGNPRCLAALSLFHCELGMPAGVVCSKCALLQCHAYDEASRVDSREAAIM
jgi:hypothetical protein